MLSIYHLQLWTFSYGSCGGPQPLNEKVQSSSRGIFHCILLVFQRVSTTCWALWLVLSAQTSPCRKCLISFRFHETRTVISNNLGVEICSVPASQALDLLTWSRTRTLVDDNKTSCFNWCGGNLWVSWLFFFWTRWRYCEAPQVTITTIWDSVIPIMHQWEEVSLLISASLKQPGIRLTVMPEVGQHRGLHMMAPLRASVHLSCEHEHVEWQSINRQTVPCLFL